MISTCKSCNHEIGEAEAMPSFIYFLGGAFLTGLCLPLLPGPDWVMLAAFLPLWILFATSINELPLFIDWLKNLTRVCPKCGGRKWTYPKYSGFGL